MNDDIPMGSTLHPHHLHQIRNRLTVVKGVAQLLDRHVRRDDWKRDKIVERVDRLQDEIAQLEDLVESFSSSDEAFTDDTASDPVH